MPSNRLSRAHLGEVLIDILSDHKFIYKDREMNANDLYKHTITGWLEVWTINIIRNYRGEEARIQMIEVVDLDSNVLFSEILTSDELMQSTLDSAIDFIHNQMMQ
mgnify:CR=1 FL=1|tara:strand:- start:123 stop:437 length:315 start_codon:yes stop_codon:yes gene_type:complete